MVGGGSDGPLVGAPVERVGAALPLEEGADGRGDGVSNKWLSSLHPASGMSIPSIARMTVRWRPPVMPMDPVGIGYAIPARAPSRSVSRTFSA
jgi:hypothetical protein